jgi:hypothetical protein
VSGSSWRRRAALAAAACAVLGTALPTCASAAPSAPAAFTAVLEARRVTAGPTHLALRFTNGTGGYVSAVAAMWGLDRSMRVTAHGLFVTTGGRQAPETNVPGAPTGCRTLPAQPAVICESRVGGTTTVDVSLDTARATDTDRIVLAFVGDRRVFSASLGKATSGWRLATLRRSVRVVRTQDSDSTWLTTSGETVEHFRGAQLPARGESLAFAGLPCRDVPGAAVAGHGAAQLSDGAASTQMGCEAGKTQAFRYSPKASRWSLSGDTWGATAAGEPATGSANSLSYSSEDIRLVVADGPF